MPDQIARILHFREADLRLKTLSRGGRGGPCRVLPFPLQGQHDLGKLAQKAEPTQQQKASTTGARQTPGEAIGG